MIDVDQGPPPKHLTAPVGLCLEDKSLLKQSRASIRSVDQSDEVSLPRQDNRRSRNVVRQRGCIELNRLPSLCKRWACSGTHKKTSVPDGTLVFKPESVRRRSNGFAVVGQHEICTVQETRQRSSSVRLLQLTNGLTFDLPNTLTCDLEDSADLF